MNTKLFVGNLSFNTTENDLQDAFAAHGTVVEANIMTDRASGRPRGFAFVTMGTPEAAQTAIQKMNGADLDGRPLRVNEAEERRDVVEEGEEARCGHGMHARLAATPPLSWPVAGRQKQASKR